MEAIARNRNAPRLARVAWSAEEERVLFECLLTQPRVEPYGLRAGWVDLVITMFNARVPWKNPNPTAIHSKYRMMRREHGVVRMLLQDGFWLDEESHLIVGEDWFWDAWMQVYLLIFGMS
ncbi:hypothetical protein COLO4_15589 [Corchorus olitorius]|uniref:Myb/SANT-like domain-containing protein n=1 Tax=Corchorus olitorius TaxID=93759 RepID=A0A1R3JMA6_9ROSI|nr:hypothetical protein COLO4_15589 [Corchorus olitorius]